MTRCQKESLRKSHILFNMIMIDYDHYYMIHEVLYEPPADQLEIRLPPDSRTHSAL